MDRSIERSPESTRDITGPVRDGHGYAIAPARGCSWPPLARQRWISRRERLITVDRDRPVEFLTAKRSGMGMISPLPKRDINWELAPCRSQSLAFGRGPRERRWRVLARWTPSGLNPPPASEGIPYVPNQTALEAGTRHGRTQIGVSLLRLGVATGRPGLRLSLPPSHRKPRHP
jgi:hypothetical protein